jgi:hypothetical protein
MRGDSRVVASADKAWGDGLAGKRRRPISAIVSQGDKKKRNTKVFSMRRTGFMYRSSVQSPPEGGCGGNVRRAYSHRSQNEQYAKKGLICKGNYADGRDPFKV